MTLSHPHGQIYAYPFVTPRVEKVLASVRRHREATGGDLFAEVVAAERPGRGWSPPTSTGPRSCRPPPAGPTRCSSSRCARCPTCRRSTDAERDAFVEVYLDVLARFARRFDTPMPYIAVLEPGAGAHGREDWWLHLQLFSLRRAPGKLKYLAGSESGMGAFITDTNPEDVAEQLRSRGGRVSDDEAPTGRRRPSPSGSAPPRGRLGRARPGQRHRRAHRLQRRLRAARGAAAHHPRRRRPAGRRTARAGLAAGRRAVVELALDGAARPAARTAGRATRPASWTGSRERLAGGVSVLVDSDVPVGRGAVLVGGADLLGRAGAARPGGARADAATDLVELARAVRRTTSSAPRPGSSTSRRRCSARPAHALFLDTRDRRTEQVPLDLAAAGLELLVVDTGTSHDHADGGYGDRRRECEEAAAPAGGAGAARRRRRRRLAALADGTSAAARRARHIVTENARVLEVVPSCAGDADPRAIGPVLTAGHASLRDDFEISTRARRLRRRRGRGRRARRPHGRRRLRRQRRRPGRPRPGRGGRRRRPRAVRAGGLRRPAHVRRRPLGRRARLI